MLLLLQFRLKQVITPKSFAQTIAAVPIIQMPMESVSMLFSTDGKYYQSLGITYQLTWGGYLRDRIGIFNFNTEGYKGYVDVDWFQYNHEVIGKDKN